jgi:hypothetical protein
LLDGEAMSMSNPSSEEALFAEALKRPTPEARVAFSRDACEDNAALCQRIAALLRAVAEAGEFLEQPPATFPGGPRRDRVARVP